MKKGTRLFVVCLVSILLSGCAIFKPAAPTPTFPPTETAVQVLPSPTPLPPTQVLPSPTPQPSATTTSGPVQPLHAVITVDNFKLRTGPGFLFDAVALYDSSTNVTVLGRAQGDNWFYVETQDNRSGWMKMEYLELTGDYLTLPFIAPTNVQTIVGHVRTQNDVFASGIGILLSPQSGYSGTNGDSALTDSNGTFYLFLPKNLEGEYFIETNAYNCTGNLITGDCELPYVFPAVQPVTLPMPAGVTIEFVLK